MSVILLWVWAWLFALTLWVVMDMVFKGKVEWDWAIGCATVSTVLVMGALTLTGRLP